ETTVYPTEQFLFQKPKSRVLGNFLGGVMATAEEKRVLVERNCEAERVFLWEDASLGIDRQHALSLAGYGTVRRFVGLGETKAAARAALVAELGLDPATAEGRLALSVLVGIWGAAGKTDEKEESLRAEAKVMGVARPVTSIERIAMRKVVEARYGKKPGSEIPVPTYLAETLEEVENSEPAASRLDEILSIEDSKVQSISAGLNASGLVQVARTKNKVLLPSNSEELRTRLKVESNAWLMLKTKFPNRTWLRSLDPTDFLDYAEYLLGKKCYNIQAQAGTGAGATEVPPRLVREEAAPLSDALKQACKNQELKELSFLIPLAHSSSSVRQGAKRSWSPGAGGAPGAQGAPGMPGQGKKALKKAAGQAKVAKAQATAPAPAPNGAKGAKGSKGAGKGEFVNLTPDNRQMCWGFNSQAGCLVAGCARVHVCNRKGCLKASGVAAVSETEHASTSQRGVGAKVSHGGPAKAQISLKADVARKEPARGDARRQEKGWEAELAQDSAPPRITLLPRSACPQQVKVLYIFAGANRKSSIGDFLRKNNLVAAQVTAVDVLRDPTEGDVAIAAVWAGILADLQAGVYHVLIISPSCNSFTRANWAGGWPKPCRSKACSRNVKAPSRRNRAGSPKTSPRIAPASPGSRRKATESARGYADSVATIEAFDFDEPEDEVPVLAQDVGPKPLGKRQARRRPAKRLYWECPLCEWRTKTKWWIQEKQRHVSAWHPAEAASLNIDRKQLCVERELTEGEEVAWKCPLCTQGMPSGTLASATAGAYGRRLASLVRGDGLEHEVSMFRWPAGCRNGRSDVICNKCKQVRKSVRELAKLPCELISVGHEGCPCTALLQRLQLQADSAAPELADKIRDAIRQLTPVSGEDGTAAAPNRYGMRIAAMTAQTLVAKLALVIAIAEEYSIENKVGACGQLSAWVPLRVSLGGRAMRVRVQRPHKRHLEARNLYLHASDPAAAVDLGEALLKAGAEGGEDRIFVGDWNRTMEEAPAAQALANGALHTADDVGGIERAREPTRHNGRRIDYAFISFNVAVKPREQHRGLADHDLVVYELESDALELPSRRRAPARLRAASQGHCQAFRSRPEILKVGVEEDVHASVSTESVRTLGTASAIRSRSGQSAPATVDVHAVQGEAAGLEDETSEEEEPGIPRPKLKDHRGGIGKPLQSKWGGKDKNCYDGAGLCSAGRWAPYKRVGTKEKWPGLLKDCFKAILVNHIENPVKLVCRLACGKVSDSPFSEEMIEQGRFKVLGGPDWRAFDKAPISFSKGVQIGTAKVRLPRTPAVFERKVRFRSYDESPLEAVMANYQSTAGIEQTLEEQFKEEEILGMMFDIPDEEAEERWGDELRIAAQGAINKKDDSFRIAHDGDVNFALEADVAKAHRRCLVREAGWGLQCCRLSKGRTWVNRVGTFGVSSAGYHSSRLAGGIARLVWSLSDWNHWIFQLIYADDLRWTASGPNKFWDLLLFLYLWVLVGTPFSWAKTKGGIACDYVGYWLDFGNFEIGISEGRAQWMMKWIKEIIAGKHVLVRHLREGLGRLGFASGVLEWSKPFLAPLYSWAAAAPQGAFLPVPPVIKLTLGHGSRAIAASELLASLFCILAFLPGEPDPLAGELVLTGVTDNQGNTFIVNKMLTTKWPVAPVLMEVTSQLAQRPMWLQLKWAARELNTEVDALTNYDFQLFDQAKRIPICYEQIMDASLVLKRYLRLGETFYQDLAEIKNERATTKMAVTGRLKKADRYRASNSQVTMRQTLEEPVVHRRPKSGTAIT
ncbi:unnamed protein product, partial [Polarella glacialis]